MMSSNEIEIANLSLESVEVKNRHSALMAKKKPLEAELTVLKNRVRSSQSHKMRMSPSEYRQVCNRQAVVGKKLAELELEAAPLKARLREIAALSNLYYAERASARSDAAALASDPLLEMRKAINILRGQWLAFAEDQTRVNSMRLMAAQFSRELTDILAAASTSEELEG